MSCGDCGKAKNAAGLRAARHEIVAGALRRRLRQHRRFDIHEARLVEKRAQGPYHVVAQTQIPVHRFAPEIQIAVTEPELLAGGFVVMKRRRLRLVEHGQPGSRRSRLRRSPCSGWRCLPAARERGPRPTARTRRAAARRPQRCRGCPGRRRSGRAPRGRAGPRRSRRHDRGGDGPSRRQQCRGLKLSGQHDRSSDCAWGLAL